MRASSIHVAVVILSRLSLAYFIRFYQVLAMKHSVSAEFTFLDQNGQKIWVYYKQMFPRCYN